MGRGVESPSLVTLGSLAGSIAALVALSGCTPIVTLASGGNQHRMSEDDAQYAERLVEKEPGDQVRLCAYWRQIADSTRQPHSVSSGLSGWIDGRRADVCFGIRPETLTSSAAGDGSPGTSTTEDLAALEPVLQKLKTISDTETSSGECDQRRRAELQSRLNESRTLPNFVNKFHELRLLWHRIQPLSPDGSTFIVPVPLGGTLHVFALGYSSLDLHVASEAATSRR